jgi:hypothetical protein
MSIAEPPKRKREQPVLSENKHRVQQMDVQLNAEEIARLTEPRHRKAVTELCRELALMAVQS